ncbi:MAG: hypothetical protein HOV81_27725 [Kofleriaceae bacterium]|nr:hypothetical protein [Kofleriaceae bacterium]
MLARRVGVLACLFATSCSWAFVKPPPADYDDPEDCTESRVAPVIDTGFAVLSALLVLGIANHCYQAAKGTNTEEGTPEAKCGVGEYVGLTNTAVMGILTTLSARSGYHRTRRCRELRALQPMQLGQR